MYRFFAKDEVVEDTSLTGHRILHFVQDKIKIEKLSKIGHCSYGVIYINDLGCYNHYDHIIKNLKKTKIIIDFSYESGMSNEYRDNVLSYFRSLGIDQENVLFVLNSASAVNKELQNFNVCFFDYFAADARRRIEFDNFSQLKVNQRSSKLSFLVAKLRKIPRFLTLYYFYKKNLLDESILSILASHEDILFHRENFPEIEEAFYDKIQHYYGPKYDNLSEKDLGRNPVGVSYIGWPNDSRLYDESSVSVICETSERWSGWTSEFVTEKTYRTIANRHPFVIQSSPGILAYLRKRGYRTFGQVVNESYDLSGEKNLKIIEQVLDAGIDLCNKIPENSALIQEIVDHNYNKLIEIGDYEIKSLNKRLSRFIKE